MNRTEKAYRFDRIRAWAYAAASAALKAGDQEAMLVLRLTQPPMTTKQARAQHARVARGSGS